MGDNADVFPEDASETLDSDGDGVGDNTDAYPLDATRSEASAGVSPLVGVLVLAGLLAGILVMRMRKKDTGLGQQTPDIAENSSEIEPEEPVKAAPEIVVDAERCKSHLPLRRVNQLQRTMVQTKQKTKPYRRWTILRRRPVTATNGANSTEMTGIAWNTLASHGCCGNKPSST